MRNNKKTMGRPPTKPKKLKDGYYIEVRNKGASSGIKIVRDTEELMHQAVEEYTRTKQVTSNLQGWTSEEGARNR